MALAAVLRAQDRGVALAFAGFLGSPATSSGTASTQSVISAQDSASDLINPLSQLVMSSPPQSYTLPGTPNGSTQVFPEPETTWSGSVTYMVPAVLTDFTGSGFTQLAASTSTGIRVREYGRSNLSLADQQDRRFERDRYLQLHGRPRTLRPRALGVAVVGLAGYVQASSASRHFARWPYMPPSSSMTAARDDAC